MRWFYDAAFPPKNPPQWAGVAFYIGGDTPHVWSDAEIRAQPAHLYLPIYTHNTTDSAADAQGNAREMLAWAHSHGMPKETAFVVDIEDKMFQSYLSALDQEISKGGYKLCAYGQLSTILNNHTPSAGFWVGQWTDHRHMVGAPHVIGTQWADSTMLHADYDASVFEQSSEIWDIQGPTITKTVDAVAVVLPHGGVKTIHSKDDGNTWK